MSCPSRSIASFCPVGVAASPVTQGAGDEAEATGTGGMGWGGPTVSGQMRSSRETMGGTYNSCTSRMTLREMEISVSSAPAGRR